jgi:hypothetical protein
VKATTVIGGLIALFVHLPIWYYLVYQILVRVEASELMWFLYWIYVPAGLFVATATKIAEATKE